MAMDANAAADAVLLAEYHADAADAAVAQKPVDFAALQEAVQGAERAAAHVRRIAPDSPEAEAAEQHMRRAQGRTASRWPWGTGP